MNSLWLLALLFSLSSALLTLLERRLALRYIGITQRNQYYPEMQARVHAKFVKDKWWSHFQENKSLPFALHLLFILFMAGVLIYFFNVNHATFGAVTWWITYTSVEHVVATVMPIFQCDELYYTPLFSFPFGLYLDLLHFVSQVCSWIKPCNCLGESIRRHSHNLRQHYSEGLGGNKAKWVEEAASEPSWGVDIEILERILLALDEDDGLKGFFDAIPGFCNSELVQKPLHPWITTKLQRAMDGFLDRTFSSHLVPESVRNDRLITCLNAAHSALRPWEFSAMLGNFFNGHRNEALKSVEIGHSLSRWGDGADLRKIIAYIIVCAQDRDDRWRILIQEVFGVPDDVFRDHLAHGDSVLLAILINVTREDFRAGYWDPGVLESLSRFDMHNTIAERQHEFCTLWNEIVQEARTQGFGSLPTRILAEIRGPFAALHPGTDVASLQVRPAVLDWSAWYPLCNNSSHRPGSSTAHCPAGTSSTVRHYTQLITQHRSEPVLGVSIVQRPQSSLRLRRAQSYSHFPTVPLPTRPSYPSNSSPRPALVSPPPLTNSPDVVTKDAMPDFADISAISGPADPIHGSTSSSGPTVQQVDETRTTPPSVVLGSLPTPLPTPALTHSAISAMIPSSIDPSTTQTHSLQHPPEAPTLTTTPLSVSLQVTTDSDQRAISGRACEQDDIQVSRPLTPRADHGQPAPGGATAL